MMGANVTRSLASEVRADVLAQHHFRCLDHEQQAQAIRRLAAIGHGDHTIAHATGLSVEMVQHVLTDCAQEQR